MHQEIEQLATWFKQRDGTNLNSLYEDKTCKPYLGHTFSTGSLHILFRKAKNTPKKAGQFVTLWIRNTKGETIPFNINEPFDFYIIAVETENKNGFFVFSKKILAEKNILSTPNNEGKRGFRVYPCWVKTENKQAQKTQEWQTTYFIDLSSISIDPFMVFKSLLTTQY